MTKEVNKAFQKHRNETFDRVILLLDGRVKATSHSLLLHLEEMSAEKLRTNAEKEVWSLFLRGIQHLKNGAPNNQPGSMTEALSQTSLRSSTFSAALGIKPPKFEQIYFSIDYTNGHEAALFLCLRLIEAAECDLSKSRQIIQQKILTENPDATLGIKADKNNTSTLKRQMAFSFNILADTYKRSCKEFRSALVATSEHLQE